jgi:hypothetical protein
MPERPGKLPGDFARLDSRLPMTFRMESGRTAPSVGRSEAVFYEDLTIPDGKGKLYFRRYGRVYVIEASGAFQATTPPPAGPSGFRLLDDEWLFWSKLLTQTFQQRSAGIRWAVATPDPDRFEFDVGTTDRAYISQIVTGTNKSLGYSAFKDIFADSTSLSANQSTTFRGLDLAGTVTIGAAAGSGGTNLILNPGFETWTDSTHAQHWTTPNAPTTNPSREGTTVHSGSFSCNFSPIDATSGADVRSADSGSPIFTHYIQIASGSLTYRLTFYIYGNGSSAGKKFFWNIYVYTGVNDNTPTYSLSMVGGVLQPFGSGVPSISQTPFVTIDTDNAWHQYSIDFTFNPGTPSTTYYVDLELFNGGTSNSGNNAVFIDDVTFGLASTSITSTPTVRLFTEDSFSFVPTVSASGDSLTMPEFTGAYVVPTIAPSVVSGGSATLTAAYGARFGLAYTAPAGTFGLTTAYSGYFEAPGIGTTKYAIYADGDVAISNANKLKFFEPSGSGTNTTSFEAQAQAADARYQWPNAFPSGANQVLTATSATPSVMSWAGLSSLGAITQITGDSGTATPSAGNINLLGGTNGIDTIASGSTVTFNFDPSEVLNPTWADGIVGSSTWTWNLSGAAANDPSIQFSIGVISLFPTSTRSINLSSVEMSPGTDNVQALGNTGGLGAGNSTRYSSLATSIIHSGESSLRFKTDNNDSSAETERLAITIGNFTNDDATIQISKVATIDLNFDGDATPTNISNSGQIAPASDSLWSLGTAALRWLTVYTTDIRSRGTAFTLRTGSADTLHWTLNSGILVTSTFAGISATAMGGSTITGIGSTLSPQADNSSNNGTTAARWGTVNSVNFQSSQTAMTFKTHDNATTNTTRLTLGVGAAEVDATWAVARNVFAASTATKSSTNIPAGTAPTTPVEGDFWNDSTRKAEIGFLDGINNHRVGGLYVLTSDDTVANTSSKTNIIDAGGAGTRTLPANFFTTGKTLHLKVMGKYSTLAVLPGNITFTVELTDSSSTTVTIAVSAAAAVVASMTNQVWTAELLLTCRTTGATGTVQSQGNVVMQTGTTTSMNVGMPETGTRTIDTTKTQEVKFSVTWSVADAANTITATNTLLETTF